MSSSYRDLLSARGKRALMAGAAVAAAVVVPVAEAADYFVQPRAEVRVETNTNRDLNVPPESTRDAQAYIAEASATIGVATPRSETTLKPFVRYQDFSRNDQAKSVEGILDLRSRYRTERSTFNLFGRFDHRDTSNSERASPQGGGLDPENPTAPETGLINPGQTRDLLQVRPEFSYQVTERAGVGASAQYQNVRYSGTTSRIDYDYLQGRVYLSWMPGQRSSLTLGPYASTYSAKSANGADTDAYGVLAEYTMKWTERLESRLSGGYEHNKTTPAGLNPVKDSSDGWVASVGLTYRGEISSISASVSHLLTPSGTGKSKSDQLRVDFNRDITQRVSLQGGVWYNKNKSITGNSFASGWKYGNAELGLQWKMSRYWYIKGLVSYERERFQSQGRWANNKSVGIAVGYEGLGRQKR